MKLPFSFLLPLLAGLAAACCTPKAITPTDRPCAAVEEGISQFEAWAEDPGSIPVAFVYDGQEYTGLGSLEPISKDCRKTPAGKALTARFRLDDQVEVRAEAALNGEFGETEYTVWFENTGTGPSRVLKDLRSAVIRFPGAEPEVRGCLGDHGHLYSDYDMALRDTVVRFASGGGRATHGHFPYFDLVHGDGGTLMALGWAGTWWAEFIGEETETLWTAGHCNGFESVLLPGEKVRTAMVVLLPYKGRDRDDASNLWREWFLKYNLPKADAKGHDIQPFSTTNFAWDTGLPNSDGSISERFYTWKRTLERLVYEDVVPDFRWFDAGWYFDQRGHSEERDWYEAVGSWIVDTVKWPGKTLLESNEACHKQGMKVLTWFESEGVGDLDDMVRYHGFKPEWGAYYKWNRYTINLGDPECLEWILTRITKMMAENGVDLYREDNNSDPVRAWREFDGRTASQTGLPRTGITENKAVQGHYELWDRILGFCAKNGKCTFIDNCASGGGRNDIESLRRSIPFMRSDDDRTTMPLRLSMTWSFCRWVPFHGANTKEAPGHQAPGIPGGSTHYITRCSWLPVYNLEERWTHDVALDYDRLRSTFGEWKKYRHLLVKDFYPLTPWHGPRDASDWTVFVWHDRKTDEAVLQAFRQEDCPEPAYTAVMPFLRPETSYTLTNEDTGEVRTLTGTALAGEGLELLLDEPKSSAIWHILPQ